MGRDGAAVNKQRRRRGGRRRRSLLAPRRRRMTDPFFSAYEALEVMRRGNQHCGPWFCGGAHNVAAPTSFAEMGGENDVVVSTGKGIVIGRRGGMMSGAERKDGQHEDSFFGLRLPDTKISGFL